MILDMIPYVIRKHRKKIHDTYPDLITIHISRSKRNYLIENDIKIRVHKFILCCFSTFAFSNQGPQSAHIFVCFPTGGPSKEWKPKPNPNLARESGTAGSVEAPTTVETNTHTQASSVLSVLDSKEDTIKLQRKLEDLHISDGQHVFIPNHLHVPEAEKIGFCFGSFDASFGLNTSANSGPENDSNTTPLSETSESVEETAEQSSRFVSFFISYHSDFL